MDGRYIGVDVGGTKVAVATLDRGRLVDRRTVTTERASSERLVDQLCSIVDSAAGAGADAVGIGVPSVVEFATGRVRYSVNVPLADVPLRQVLSARTGVPVFVDNDATCAALAEAHGDGAARATDLVMLTVGTGIGGGIVLGGRPYRGVTGAAGEFGHVVVGLDVNGAVPGPTEGFPRRGSLEAVAAGTALDELGEQLARRQPDSELGRVLAEHGAVNGRDVARAALAGDGAARSALALIGARLGLGIANVINIFDPAEVVIGGGVSEAGELLLDPAIEVAGRYVVPGVGSRTVIRLARQGCDAGVLGAALLAAHELARSEPNCAERIAPSAPLRVELDALEVESSPMRRN